MSRLRLPTTTISGLMDQILSRPATGHWGGHMVAAFVAICQPRSMARKPRVTVVGSFAVGLTLRALRFPVAGETLLASGFEQGPGGKGSNQAVQAARMGAEVEFVGVVGSDGFGDIGLALWKAEGVGTG